jgi:hypothetical protein
MYIYLQFADTLRRAERDGVMPQHFQIESKLPGEGGFRMKNVQRFSGVLWCGRHNVRGILE